MLLPKSVVRKDAQDKPVFADVWAGLIYVARHPKLRLLVSLFVLVILAGFPHVTVLPGLVENVYRLEAADVSSLFEYLMLGMFLVGYGSGGFQSLNSAVIAHHTEVDYIGRVMSLVLLAFAGFGLMSLPYGFLADRWGEPNTLLLMGVVVLGLCGLFAVLVARRAIDFAESEA